MRHSLHFSVTLLTLNLLTTTIVAPPSNASKWQMGFNSTFKGLRDMSPCFYTYGSKDSGELTASIYRVLTKIRQPYVVGAVRNLNDVKPDERVVKCSAV